MSYSLNDFDYHLPEELIAQTPANKRDEARLLVYNRESKSIYDDFFYNIAKYLERGTTLVANNSKVEKCRLFFDEGKIEIFILNVLNDKTVEALVRPGKNFKKNTSRILPNGVTVRVDDIAPDGVRTLTLSHAPDDPVFEEHRFTPFPPYILQDETLSDKYQTIFARDAGSKAAPTAGLHFTPALIENLKHQGFGWEEVTLHVGMGTFAPVKSDKIDDHIMHSEWYQMDKKTASELNRALHITAVGTTSVRVLESVFKKFKHFKAYSGETDIFIRPGFKFRTVDSLITNFHLPKSTLLMLVAAFAGYDEMQSIYQHAIKEKYRFYSFGDAMLIL